MSFKFWNKFFLVTAFSFFIVTATFNFIVNPYGLFNHHLFSDFMVIKKHTVSSRMQIFYDTIHNEPQNIMMGSSRIGMLPPSAVSKYLGGPTKNMAMEGTNIEEQSQYLLYMIKNTSVKNIVWSMDFFSFNPDLANDIDFNYDRLESSIHFNSDHKISLLGFQATKNSFLTLYDNFKASDKNKEVHKRFLSDEDGETKRYQHYNTLKQNEVDEITAWQIENYTKKFLVVKTFDSPHSIDPNIKKIHTVINACKKKKIKLVIYTSPVSKDFLQLYKDLNLEDTFKYWKKGLADITAYTDFCYLNDITKNPYNFLDASHLMPKYSALLFARVFNDPSIKGPKDFGKYINKKSKN